MIMTNFEEILNLIKSYKLIIVLRHQNPDPDAIGSQCGLRSILRENFPEKEILSIGFNEPTLAYLAKMDDIPTTFDVPYLTIVCDTANRPRIDGEYWETANKVIKIDHHPNNDAYGDLQWVDSKRSSTSEMIADWTFSLSLRMPDEGARLLYAGIVGDTGRFLYPSTSAKTLALSAKLAEYKFDRAALGREMSSFGMKVARLQGYVYENLEISDNGAARIILTSKILDDYGLTDAETSGIVATPGNISDIQSWAIFVEQPDGHFRVRMRSKTIPIDAIAKKHGGGGHALASGANAYSLKEIDQIWQELQKNI